MKNKSTAAQAVCMKTTPLMVKAAGPDDGLADGEFIAYASVFGNVDSYGDIVEPTAFNDTLAAWKDSGDTIPVLWGHDVYDPFNNIGGLKSAEPDERGLKVHGQLDIADNPTAAQVYRLMKGRRTTKMSFAYAIRDAKQEDDGYHLNAVDLFEVSVVQIPANQEAEILTVKHATDQLLKAGRVLSAKNEAALREARDSIDSVLKALESEDSGDGKGGTSQQSKASEANQAKGGASSEDPSGDKEHAPSEEPKSAPSVEAMGLLFGTYASAYAEEGVTS